MLRVFLVIDDYNELMYLQTLLKKLGMDVETLQNQKKYSDVSLGFNPNIVIASGASKKVDSITLAQSIPRKRGLPKFVVLQRPGQKISSEDIEVSGIDEVLDSPVNVKKLILAVSQMGGLDENVLLDKYNKMKGTLAQEHGAGNFTSYDLDENGQPVDKLENKKAEIESIAKKSLGDNVIDQKDFDLVHGLLGPNFSESVGQEIPDEASNVEIEEGLSDESAAVRKNRYEQWLKTLNPLDNEHFDRERILAFNKKIRSAEMPEDIMEVEDERKKFVKALFKKLS